MLFILYSCASINVISACFFICRMDDLLLKNWDFAQNIQRKHAPLPKGFKSWKEYWCDQSDEKWPKRCRFRGCGEPANGSAHVNINGDESSVYIIPICDKHNCLGYSEPFNVNSGTCAVYIDEVYLMQQRIDDLVAK